MEINPFISDKNGLTSLMRASEHKVLFFVVENLINYNEDLVNIVDNNGENALFHALDNPIAFEYLLNTKVNINHLNNNKETVLFISCKTKIKYDIYKLMKHSDFDYSFTYKEDSFGITPLMYILENENYELFIDILKILKKKALKSPDSVVYNINHRNKANQSLLSIIIKKYYQMCCAKSYNNEVNGKKDLSSFITVAFALIISYPGCDINISIDDIGNTPIMFFLMIEDYIPVNFIMANFKDDVDLSIKNKNGISTSALVVKIKNEPVLLNQILNHKTFDNHFIDQYNNNLLIYSILYDNPYIFTRIINDNPKAVINVNNKNENFIIPAVKLGLLEKVNNYIISDANFNQQDHLGNTALFYAVKMKNIYDVNLLSLNHSDPNIKNNQGMSAMDLAKQMGEEELIKYMNSPISINDMKKLKDNKSGRRFFSKPTSDQKIENYIKNYQINNYTEDYKEIFENCKDYLPIESRSCDTDEKIAFFIYMTMDYCNYYPMRRVDPKEIYNFNKELNMSYRNILKIKDSIL